MKRDRQGEKKAKHMSAAHLVSTDHFLNILQSLQWGRTIIMNTAGKERSDMVLQV